MNSNGQISSDWKEKFINKQTYVYHIFVQFQVRNLLWVLIIFSDSFNPLPDDKF